ncbi:carbonic anhydrase 2-like isoform X1 [Notechis scutatus]|uniref:carbonic anhydrase n=1 Tax=Notechis scutatus TaxID=8663 RepID=A0A6J1VFA8_9SAUR|nr:carbonic anhydrase 2-like isoform X1 [Notechis scutatus]XP_026539253.1 carbonic anhydrase 2-like isoform X1 [Notechis scutatus]
MGSVGFPLKLSACILIFLILENFCVTCDNHWCYDLQSCGPSTWGPIGSCNGKRQSPINIDTNTVISDSPPRPIHFFYYEDLKIATKLENTGYQLKIDFHPKARIFCDDFPEFYFLHQAHFHWGTENKNGAEHTIDGKRYAMEMHLVHTKNNMSIEDASKEPDGLIVLAFLVKKTEGNNQVNGWNTLAKFLKDIPEKGNSKNLNGEFNLGSLLRTADVNHYFHYQGSLTTPPCAEAVIWIVFESPLEISYQLHKVFTTSLYFTTIQENRKMQNNFRPLQALNGRSVYYSYYSPARKPFFGCLTHCIGKQF